MKMVLKLIGMLKAWLLIEVMHVGVLFDRDWIVTTMCRPEPRNESECRM